MVPALVMVIGHGAKGLGQRHADPYIGPGIPESDKKETKETNFRDLSLTFTTRCWNSVTSKERKSNNFLPLFQCCMRV